MSMDLSEDCPHCEAKAGEGCSLNCEVNGKKVEQLIRVLHALDLTTENITIKFSGYYEPLPPGVAYALANHSRTG